MPATEAPTSGHAYPASFALLSHHLAAAIDLYGHVKCGNWNVRGSGATAVYRAVDRAIGCGRAVRQSDLLRAWRRDPPDRPCSPCEGRTRATEITQTEQITGAAVARINSIAVTPVTTPSGITSTIRRELRRNAVEPQISQMKSDGHPDRNFLLGRTTASSSPHDTTSGLSNGGQDSGCFPARRDPGSSQST